jgi:nucleoside 2-deoxyribosyltransferase
MKKVFLSGPIRGLPREQSLGWRAEAQALLKDDFEVIHALRGREEKETLPDYRLAITRDKRDIESCDIVLLNDTFAQASMIGSSMEALYAYERGKTVILFGDAHPHDYWLNFHSYARVRDLGEACDLVKRFFK